ncbi:uncharacterized protein LOC114533629 isoform X2 [Dendronephthya gigantea]|uniref:uncharacterized protein LOC114533629 isoform X2 n=1 Tax=Dendronephthya gigantea TaxID=151771 RepID=UPI00106BA9F4|nr:uncharacterized protein LOC114533629 isoform X2 [Dendronephthya gigantea]
MKTVFVVFILGTLIALTHSYDRQKESWACEGDTLNLDCRINARIQMLTANFGRTNKKRCGWKNDTSNINCISTKAKNIIYRKCDGRNFCSVKASSANLGGDPCPGVFKYIDVIFKCVNPTRKTTTTTPPKTTDNFTTAASSAAKTSKMQPTTLLTDISTGAKIFRGTMNLSNDTNSKASSKRANHGFFRSVLVLLIILKDKPKHSMLSVQTGVAAGAVIALFTILVCVCVDKRRQRNESGTFKEAKQGQAFELEKSQLIGRKSNSDSAKTDDQVDSAFCDEELDRQVSNDYETASDLAYLDAYLDEYNKNHSLPRPPMAENGRRDSGPQRMSRRAHNDGSKGRSYDYNSNNDKRFITFS